MPKKDPAQTTLFPETLYEYHILLSPSDAVKEDVDNLKQVLHEMIGLAERDRTSIAHITLLKFEAFESTNVKEMVKKAVSGERKFTIKVEGHGTFTAGNERTLYLKLHNPEPVDQLAALIKPGKRQPKKRDRQISILDKPQRRVPTINPHITIARNITAEDYERITDFEPFNYEAEWVCDRITLRRRIAGTAKFFSPAGEVRLG